LQAERDRLGAEAQGFTEQVTGLTQQIDVLTARLRDSELRREDVAGDRGRLLAEIDALRQACWAAESRAAHLDEQARGDRAATDTEREALRHQIAIARAALAEATTERDALAQSLHERTAARDGAVHEAGTLRAALADTRDAFRHAEAAWQADRAVLEAETRRLATTTAAQQAADADREAASTALRDELAAVRRAEAQVQQICAALTAELSGVRTQLAEARTESARWQESDEARARQLAALLAEHGEGTRTLAVSQERIAYLERAQRDLARDLDAARRDAAAASDRHAVALADAQTSAEAVRARVAAVTRDADETRRELEALRQTLTEQTETSAAEREQTETLRARCGQLEASLDAAEDRARNAAAEHQRLEAELVALRAASEDRAALVGRVKELGDELAAAQRVVETARAEATRAEQQRMAALRDAESTRDEQARAAAAVEAECETLRAALARQVAAFEQLSSERETLAADRDTIQAQGASVQARLDEEIAQRRRAETDLEDAGQRLAEGHRQLEATGRMVDARDAALRAATSECARLTTALAAAESAAAESAADREALQARIDEVVDELERLRPTPGAEAAGLPDAVAEEPMPAGPLVIERAAPLNEVVDSGAAIADVTVTVAPTGVVAPAGELVLLDEGGTGDAAAAALAAAGFEVTVLPPTAGGVDEVARRKVRCIMLNVALGAGAWQVLRDLRERVATRSVPILVYAMRADATAGFCLGRADFALWPADPARLIERLGRLRPKLRRVLALSADIDGMGQLREPLAQARISTSVVLDGKQALEFASMVDPEAAMLHVSPACPSVVRAIAGLRAAEPTRQLPLLILLDKTPGARDDGFLAGVAQQLLVKPTFRFDNLPEEIARVIG